MFYQRFLSMPVFIEFNSCHELLENNILIGKYFIFTFFVNFVNRIESRFLDSNPNNLINELIISSIRLTPT